MHTACVAHAPMFTDACCHRWVEWCVKTMTCSTTPKILLDVKPRRWHVYALKPSEPRKMGREPFSFAFDREGMQ